MNIDLIEVLIFSHLVGWKYQDVVASLEAKRKVVGTIRAQRMAKKKAAASENLKKLRKSESLKTLSTELKKYGY